MEHTFKIILFALIFVQIGWFFGEIMGFGMAGKIIAIIAVYMLCVVSCLVGVFCTLHSMNGTKHMIHIDDGRTDVFIDVSIFGFKHRVFLEPPQEQP